MTKNIRSHFQVLGSRFVFMFGSGFVVLCSVFAWSVALGAQPPIDGPQYTNGNTLVRPANYREWIFLGSGLGMTYDASAAGTTFTNVFVGADGILDITFKSALFSNWAVNAIEVF